MPNYKITAIILKRINLGEADRIVTAFSLEKGMIRFVAKGVRRTKSKLAGSIEPFCLCSLVLAEGRNLDILTSADILKNYIGLNPNLEKVKFANFIAEVLDKLIQEDYVNRDLFQLTEETLSAINSLQTEKLRIYFLTNFLYQAGVLPEISKCIICGKKPKGKIYFSPQAGGIMDEDCCLYQNDSVQTNVNALKVIGYASSNRLASFNALKIPHDNLIETLKMLDDYLKTTYQKTFKSDSI